MKKLNLFLVVLLSPFCLLQAQDAYKQNFLNLLKSLPETQTCENSYNFLKCTDNSCKDYQGAKSIMEKAMGDLTSVQLASNTAMLSVSQSSSMTSDQANTLKNKLEKMSPEEKQKWAMQYAQNYMGATPVHANLDMDNTVVNDAVKYVTNQQEEDLNELIRPVDVLTTFKTIVDKYKLQKNSILKTFQTASGVNYDPSSSSPYIFGVAGDDEVAKFNKALVDYKKEITIINNSELKDKLAFLKVLTQQLITKYSTAEEKIATTHYGVDAKENVNKNHLYLAHKIILNRVIENFGFYENVIHEYANKYADIEKKDQIK